MKRALALILAGVLVPVAACSAAAGSGPKPEQAGDKNDQVLVAADANGAILADFDAGFFRGVDRSGRQLWEDRDAMRTESEIACAATCPTPVHSVADGVEVGGDGQTHWLQLADTRVPLPSAQLAWAENPERTEAVALSPKAEGKVLRLHRDATGWRLVDDTTPAGDAYGACTAGDTALLTGPSPVLLKGTQRIPLRVEGVAECVLGAAGGVVLKRLANTQHKHKTTARGIDQDGNQTWSRDLPCDASVSAHPSGRTFALACNGKLEMVDHSGQTIARADDVVSVRYTASGELVRLKTDLTVERVAP